MTPKSMGAAFDELYVSIWCLFLGSGVAAANLGRIRSSVGQYHSRRRISTSGSKADIALAAATRRLRRITLRLTRVCRTSELTITPSPNAAHVGLNRLLGHMFLELIVTD